jgi:hypothetical protein
VEAHKGAAKDSSIVEDGEQVLYCGVGGARGIDTQRCAREWPVHLTSIPVKQCDTALGACVQGSWADDGMWPNERSTTYRWAQLPIDSETACVALG